MRKKRVLELKSHPFKKAGTVKAVQMSELKNSSAAHEADTYATHRKRSITENPAMVSGAILPPPNNFNVVKTIQQVLASDQKDPISGNSLKQLSGLAFAQGFPFLVACVRSSSKQGTGTHHDLETSSDFSICDGTLTALMLCAPDCEMLSNLTQRQLQVLKSLCANDLDIYAVQGSAKLVSHVATKNALKEKWEQHSCVSCLLCVNHLIPMDSDDASDAYQIAAMLYCGKYLCEDKVSAAVVFEWAKKNEGVESLADAGITLVTHGETKVFSAFLALGADIYKGNRVGISTFQHAKQFGNPEIKTIIEEHSTSMKNISQ